MKSCKKFLHLTTFSDSNSFISVAAEEQLFGIGYLNVMTCTDPFRQKPYRFQKKWYKNNKRASRTLLFRQSLLLKIATRLK